MSESNLLLKDQLCFPLYATSRMITRLYLPYLKEIELTYPQYLVMLVLWEKDNLKVNDIGNKLYLNSNTLTPLINNMKEKGLLVKERSFEDERTVYIRLTAKGNSLKNKGEAIPLCIVESMNMSLEDLQKMRSLMWKFLKGFEFS